MKYLVCILCMLLIFISMLAQANDAHCQKISPIDRACDRYPPENKVRRLECQALVLITKAGHSKESIHKALKLLGQARSIAPHDLFVLNNIAFCYIKLNKYKTALQITEKMLKIQPSALGARFFNCLLKERLGYPTQEWLACYQSAVQGLKNSNSPKDVTYVFALLMAKDPDAQAVKDKYLAGLEPDTVETKMWNDMLKDFDRKKYLRKILP
jgi:tetratricopeptide (TPR) repeat protein